jgi:hypothetical protein
MLEGQISASMGALRTNEPITIIDLVTDRSLWDHTARRWLKEICRLRRQIVICCRPSSCAFELFAECLPGVRQLELPHNQGRYGQRERNLPAGSLRRGLGDGDKL